MKRFFTLATMTLCCLFLLSCAAGETGDGNGARAAPTPKIVLKPVPKFGAPNASISGRVSGIAPTDYKAAVFIGLDQAFYNKPSYTQPDTPLAKNGSFTCNITTGTNDPFAQQIVVFIVPINYTVPLIMGGSAFPPDLLTNAVASIEVERFARTLSFSGNKWNVKSGLAAIGPGPNFFSASTANVFVDKKGALNLVTGQDAQNVWQCAEVVSAKPVGYGTYTFTVSGAAIQAMNENAVFGLFPYDDTLTSDPTNHSELDFEFSRWSNAADVNNAQFVVQPFNLSGHLTRFLANQAGDIVLEMNWTPTQVDFKASAGTQVIAQWSYTGSDIPAPGHAHLHLNLWLYNGTPPSDGKKQEVIIQKFRYKPS